VTHDDVITKTTVKSSKVEAETRPKSSHKVADSAVLRQLNSHSAVVIILITCLDFGFSASVN
jgi:hypothetical protein